MSPRHPLMKSLIRHCRARVAPRQWRIKDFMRGWGGFVHESRHQGRHFNFFLGGPIFLFIFQCHRTIEKLEKQHFICSNLTLFIVPFFSFFLLFFSFFSFFFSFLLFPWGRRPPSPPQPPSNDAPARHAPIITPSAQASISLFSIILDSIAN